jgi:hypothetical protein
MLLGPEQRGARYEGYRELGFSSTKTQEKKEMGLEMVNDSGKRTSDLSKDMTGLSAPEKRKEEQRAR